MSLKASNLTALKFAALLFLLLVAADRSTAQNASVVKLEPGKIVAGETKGAGRNVFLIDVAAGDAVHVTLRQQGVDLTVRLIGTDEKPIADFDIEMRPDFPENVAFVATAAGVYRLEVGARYPMLGGGKFEIVLDGVAPATPRDRSLFDAMTGYRDALRLYNSGKYEESRTAAARAAEIFKVENGTDDPFALVSLTQFARAVDALGRFDEAERLNTDILAARIRVFGELHPEVAASLNYLALNNHHKENFSAALTFHERALSLREKIFGHFHPVVAASLINLGVVYDSLGDKLKAGELYEDAAIVQEKTVGAENLNFAIILNNIGKIHDDLGEFKRAEPFLVRAAAILAKLYPPENPRNFDVLINLADCYAGQGELAKAEPLYLGLVEFYSKTLGVDHPTTALATYNLGNIYAARNDFARAEPLYRRALTIREGHYAENSPLISEVLTALAYLLAKKGAVDEALAVQQRAGDINERLLNLNLTFGSERQKFAFLAKRGEELQQSLTIQSLFAPASQLAADIAATSVLRRKGRVLDSVSNSLSELRRRFAAADRALLDELNAVTKEVAETALEGHRDGETTDAFTTRLKTLTDRRERLENDISVRAAGFYEKASPVTLAAVRREIPADAVLLEFARFAPESDAAGQSAPSHYAVYVIRAEGLVRWKDLGDAAVIDARVNEFRQALHDPKRRDAAKLGREVDELLIAPIRRLIVGAKQLLISPDGALNLIPFEALSDDTGRFLIETYAVAYLSSGRDLLRIKTERRRGSSPLIVANPAFGPTSRPSDAKKRGPADAVRSLSELYFAPLAGTRLEAASIKSIFPEATVVDADAASESALKRADAPAILHISTHGFFLADAEASRSVDVLRGLRNSSGLENPLLRSGLAMAGANSRKSGDDDGILTALEASGLDLWGTKLVVLSACETGVGEVRNGEGVYGLRRAFVLAGAESVVMSLWSVSDLATRELMTGYYKNLRRGLGRGESLRVVQLSMIARNDRRHPFYWASFIQSGNWTPLD